MKGRTLGTLASSLLAVTMVAAILLLVFGAKLALKPADRQRGRRHAPPEAGREGDGGESVERCLQGELVDAAAEPVVH